MKCTRVSAACWLGLVGAMVVAQYGCGGTDASGGGAAATVLGDWRVIKSIVGGSQVAAIDWSGDSPVPYGQGAGLSDGDSVFEDWSIVEENGQFKLTNIYGSIYGQATADGAYFEWVGEDPRVSIWGVANQLRITIECHLSSNGEIYGGIVDQLYVANGLGVLTPAPAESWTFRATRK